MTTTPPTVRVLVPHSKDQYNQFLRNIKHAEQMIAAGAHLKAEEDLYRSAWVQAVSALDYWVHQEVYERATKIVMNTQSKRPKPLEGLQIPWRHVEEIKHQRRRLEEVFRDVLEERLNWQSYQSTKRIGEAFGYVLYNVNSGTMWQRTADHLNITKEKLVAMQDDVIVKRRNQIAHESDFDTDTGKRRPITQQQATEAVDWIKNLAEALTVAIR